LAIISWDETTYTIEPDGRATRASDLRVEPGASTPAGPAMNDVTRMLAAIERGESDAAEALLPLVYEELRKLAAHRLAREEPGQTLQATALVHEAYLRLVGEDGRSGWNGRGHFFGAAAEAMRRILVESARRRVESATARADGLSPSTGSTSRGTRPRRRSWT
jgi:RNA polymerase sigma factor (TIGR02999 family)